METVRQEMPSNAIWPKNAPNEILYGAKRHLQDIEPRLTSEQLSKVYEIVGAVILDTKKAFEPLAPRKE